MKPIGISICSYPPIITILDLSFKCPGGIEYYDKSQFKSKHKCFCHRSTISLQICYSDIIYCADLYSMHPICKLTPHHSYVMLPNNIIVI